MHVIVIGGGAAGFFSAIHHQEAHPKDTVVIIEKSNDLLTKVKLSGGGRCNVTHACFDTNELCRFYPRGAKELRGPFHHFQPRDTMAWFESRGVKLKIEEDNRVFPVSDNAHDISDCLLNEAKKQGISVWIDRPIQHINKTSNGSFLVTLRSGKQYTCDKLVLATGSNRQGYSFAASLGHTIISPLPSLFTFKISDSKLHQLAGVSVDYVHIRLDIGTKNSSTGPLLITHWGFSGPAIIKASAWQAIALHNRNYQCPLAIHWLPHLSLPDMQHTLTTTIQERPKQRIHTNSPFSELPHRLWNYLLGRWQLPLPDRWNHLTTRQINQLCDRLSNDTFEISGKGTFKDEFVTCGGVDLSEIDFANMQSTLCPNLHIVGELLNIDGITGGFNFQSAWTTGMISSNSPANA
jgi:predicted Rossmann fold flavoprotein